ACGSKGFKQFKKQKLEQGVELGIPEDTTRKLIDMYGGNVETLFTIYQENKDEAAKEGIDPFVLTELIYGMENELVYKPVDFFIRRTGALLFDINWVKEHKESVINYNGFLMFFNPVNIE